MPIITGDLILVTAKAASVDELWVRAPEPRADGSRVIMDTLDVIPVRAGRASFSCLPGPAVVTLVGSGRVVKKFPILVPEGEQAQLSAVIVAAKAAFSASRNELEQLAQQAAGAVSRASGYADAARRDAEKAAQAVVGKADIRHVHVSADISDGVSSPTANRAEGGKVWLLGGDGMPSVGANPTSGTHVVRKSYVDSGFAAKTHTHTIEQISGLDTALAGKANASHSHTLSSITDAPNTHTSVATPGALMSRDSAGRAEVAVPTSGNQVANKSYVDSEVAEATSVAGPTTLDDGRIKAYRAGKIVFVSVTGAGQGNKGTLPVGYRPKETVDGFLTSPEKRGYPGWCNITKAGVVNINFSDSGSRTGYGLLTYLAD